MPINPSLEIGGTGLDQFDGFIHEEKLRQLQQPVRRLKTYQEMGDNEPVLGAMLFAIEMLIRRTDWSVEGDDDRRDFIESAFKDVDTPLEEVINEALSLLQFGFSLAEVTFKRRLGDQPEVVLNEDGTFTLPDEPSSLFDDGRWGWYRFAGRAQASVFRWVFDDASGDLLAFVQQAPPRFRPVTIPMTRLLHLRTTRRGNNPEGRSIFRSAFRPWYFKTTIEEIQAVGIERDLAGLPTLYVPEGLMGLMENLSATELTQRRFLEKLLRNVKRGAQEGMLLPSERDSTGHRRFEMELLSTGGRRQFDTKAILEYYDRRMAMVALFDMILMGHEKVGSLALSSDKTKLFATAIGAWLDVIAAPFNRRFIPQLLRLNGMPTEDAPRLVHGDIESISLEDLGDFVSNLSGAGMPLFPDDELENYLRRQAGMPEANDEVLAQRVADVEAEREAEERAEARETEAAEARLVAVAQIPPPSPGGGA